jgi:phosphate transport system permease protein
MDLRRLKSDLMITGIIIIFLLGMIPLIHIFLTVAWRGINVIARDPLGVLFKEPPIPGSEELGGIGPHVLGSLILISIASLIGIPISILSAIYTVEGMSKRLGPLTSLLVRIMIEFPTIVIGLSVYGAVLLIEEFINDLVKIFGLGGHIYIPRFNPITGAIALAIVMIPYVYTQSEDGFKNIPHHIREAVYSLGFSRIRASIVLSSYVKSALLSGIMIGVSKILSETAPLLFTAFGNDHYVTRFPDVFLNPIGSMTLWIYKAGLSPYDNWIDLAWAAAFILLMIILVLFVISRYIIYKR